MWSGQRQLVYSDFVLTLTVSLQYFIQHGYHVIMLNFVTRSHFSFIGCMFYDASMFIEPTTSVYYLLYALPLPIITK